MVNLAGLEPKDGPPPPKPAAEVAKLDGLSIHAGLSETSRIMFIRPDLVRPGVAEAPTHTVSAPGDLVPVATKPGWPGYFGAPRFASPAYGAEVMRHRAALYAGMALQILDGRDDREIPRYADRMIALDKEGGKAPLAYDETVRRKQQAWLDKRGLR
jgi:hypothetical protein